MTERGSTISGCISDWMLKIIIGSFRVVKGLTVRHWATTKGNPFLTGLGYMHNRSVPSVDSEGSSRNA